VARLAAIQRDWKSRSGGRHEPQQKRSRQGHVGVKCEGKWDQGDLIMLHGFRLVSTSMLSSCLLRDLAPHVHSGLVLGVGS
jgi:hypothetical protein